jgi:aspartate kinase
MLQEMAEAGAKVLNAQAVEWARRAKITLHARRTSDPGDDQGKPPRETIAKEAAGGSARAVVGLGQVVRARARAAQLRALADACADLAIPLMDVVVAGESAFAAVPLLNVPDWEHHRRGQLESRVPGVTLAAGAAIVSVVGDGLTTSGSALPRFLSALERAGIRGVPESLTAGALRIGACIEAEHLGAAQRSLHDEFV